ncbi:transcriptional regulator [Aneurinibacillus tyrosinisolvens]|uniref:transcriptional regulator n=1 Tax=Aneurinibacillus tyrosinisolvens TaxID=1443435 RepID=UPI00063F18E3|nr:transcriptional regulator [Aneurinibacillus tyrosinisolvens]
MNGKEALHAKTTLEYLVLVNEQSYSQIGRELHITPQQFSDWIKKRRPIPKERLLALSEYFQVGERCLVDEKNFARNLTEVTKIDIQMLLVKKIMEKGEEDISPYKEKLEKLEKEKAKQIRIGRLAAILHQENEEIDTMIDAVLEQIESGNTARLNDIISEQKRGK